MQYVGTCTSVNTGHFLFAVLYRRRPTADLASNVAQDNYVRDSFSTDFKHTQLDLINKEEQSY